MKLTHSAVLSGVWTAFLSGGEGPGEPAIEVRLNDQVLGDVTLSAAGESGRWQVQVALPAAAMSEDGGLISVSNRSSGEVIGMLQVTAGPPRQDDLRAEVARLRQEMELIKDVLRRNSRG